MLKKDLLELIKDIEDDKDIDQILITSELANKFGGLDVFKQKINTDKDFKSFIDSLKDTHLSKGLETWKQNNLQNLIDEKVKELYPEEDPKDNELRKLKIEIDNMKKEKAYEQLKNKAFKIATEKEIPLEIVENFIDADEETTVNKLNTLHEILSKRDEIIKTTLLKDTCYRPPTASQTNDNENPYSKENFNLTKQMELEMNNPDLAKQLRENIK